MLLALGLFFFASLSVLQANSLEVANEDEKEAAAVVTKNRNLLVAEDLLPSELLKHSLKRRSPSAYGGSLRLRRSPIPSPYVPRSWLRGRGRSSSYSCRGLFVKLVLHQILVDKIENLCYLINRCTFDMVLPSILSTQYWESLIFSPCIVIGEHFCVPRGKRRFFYKNQGQGFNL